jgi:hypothetical protein
MDLSYVCARIVGMEELADTVPGPGLFAQLEAVDPRACTGAELVGLVEAQARQVAYQQSRLLLTVRELAHATRDSTTRRELVDAYADTELAFALTITDYAAGVLLSAATAAVDKLPALLEALTAGRVDLAKVSMITSELSDVEDDTARKILDQLLPTIDQHTLAQLREELRTLILAVDPDHVRSRTKKTQEDRNVEHAEYANGTSSLSGMYLDKERAAAAWEHITAVAKATKAAGDPAKRDLDQLRADVFADLLSGVDPTLAGAATPADRKGAIYLHINTTTLACLDDHPGQLEGFGPVIADIARQTAAQLAEHAQWRFVVEDDDGQTVAEGRLKYRPTLAQTAFVNARDRTCRAPGCRRPARACDRDHIRDYANGGPTTIANLCCLCRRHHRAKHAGKFRIRRTEYGIDWTTPQGATYTVLPEHGQPPKHSFAVLLCRTLKAPQPGKLRR